MILGLPAIPRSVSVLLLMSVLLLRLPILPHGPDLTLLPSISRTATFNKHDGNCCSTECKLLFSLPVSSYHGYESMQNSETSLKMLLLDGIACCSSLVWLWEWLWFLVLVVRGMWTVAARAGWWCHRWRCCRTRRRHVCDAFAIIMSFVSVL